MGARGWGGSSLQVHEPLLLRRRLLPPCNERARSRGQGEHQQPPGHRAQLAPVGWRHPGPRPPAEPEQARVVDGQIDENHQQATREHRAEIRRGGACELTRGQRRQPCAQERRDGELSRMRRSLCSIWSRRTARRKSSRALRVGRSSVHVVTLTHSASPLASGQSAGSRGLG